MKTSLEKAEAYRQAEQPLIREMSNLANDRSKTSFDMLSKWQTTSVKHNGVEIRKTISGNPIDFRKSIREILPKEIKGVTMKYDNIEKVREGILASTQIGDKTKNEYINILNASVNFSNGAFEILGDVYNPVGILQNNYDTFSDFFTGKKKFKSDRLDKFLDKKMFVGNEFETELVTVQQEAVNDYIDALVNLRDTVALPAKVKPVTIPTKEVDGKKVEDRPKDLSALDNKPRHYPGSHVIITTGDQKIDEIIMKLNNSLNWYQWAYTPEGNLKP